MIVLPLLLMLASVGVPQMPIASGPFASVGEIVEAAHSCGINHLRIETERSTTAVAPEVQQYLNRAEVRLFLNDAVTPAAQRCLSSWQTKNGRRLHLEPRWWKDDFTRDEPGAMAR
jgi:hypothetical protein